MSGHPHLEFRQHILGHLEALREQLPVNVHGDVPVAEDGLVRDIDAGGPDAPGGEHPGPVTDEVTRPVPQGDVDAPVTAGLSWGERTITLNCTVLPGL